MTHSQLIVSRNLEKSGIVYCTCGQFLVESEFRRKFNKLRLHTLSIPHYIIKKGRTHGARHGKTKAKKQYHIAFNAWKRCRKRVDGQEDHYEGIYDRFLRDPVFRDSQLKIGWTEQKCIEMDKLNIDMKMIRPVNLSGVTLIFDRNSWTLLPRCNAVNPWKFSTRIPLAHHQLCPRFCIVMNF